MNIVSSYIFSKLLTSTFVVLAALIGVVWLTQSLKFIAVIVHHDISISGFFKLIFYLLPDLFSSLLSISFLLAGIYVFYKLSLDHELIVFHASGMSPHQIYRPIAVVSTIIFVAVFLCNMYVVPASFRQFREFEYKVRNHFSSGLIRAGVFNFIKDNTLYVQSKLPNGELREVFIYQQQGKKTITIIAESGILESSSNGYMLKLKKGQRQEKDPQSNQVNQLRFEDLSYNISDLIKSNSERVFKPYEKDLSELLNPPAGTNKQMRAKMNAEAHQRILTPFLVFLDGIMIALFMTRPSSNRSKHRYNFIALFFIGFLSHGGMFSLINSSVRIPCAIPIGYFSVLIAYIICFMILDVSIFKRKTKQEI